MITLRLFKCCDVCHRRLWFRLGIEMFDAFLVDGVVHRKRCIVCSADCGDVVYRRVMRLKGKQ